MEILEEVRPQVGVKAACLATDIARSSYYRRKRPPVESQPAKKRVSARALSEQEKQAVSQLLNSGRFVDAAPREVYAT